jgi:hypothetical protein
MMWQANDDLNRKIAELRGMSLQHDESIYREDENDSGFYCPRCGIGEGSIGTQFDKGCFPNWSCNIRYAWALVEEIDDEYRVELSKVTNELYHCRIETKKFMKRYGGWKMYEGDICVGANTPAKAICLAYIKYKEAIK